jgi:hypothetical protein
MAPSVAEAVSQVNDQINDKASLKRPKNGSEMKVESSPVPAVQTPSVESQHKEPLKLSGVLDIFESFDVTPNNRLRIRWSQPREVALGSQLRCASSGPRYHKYTRPASTSLVANKIPSFSARSGIFPQAGRCYE